ncbi:MAG: ribosome-binding factor A [Arenicella sp.]|jgi:ribosome-binding factor A
MPKEYARSERVAQIITRQLAMILRTQVKDPRVSSLTITDVEVTKDLRQAKVFVTSMFEDTLEIKDTMDALERANGFLRRALAAVIDMRHCPNLIFSYDNSISEGARMSALIDKALNNKD